MLSAKLERYRLGARSFGTRSPGKAAELPTVRPELKASAGPSPLLLRLQRRNTPLDLKETLISLPPQHPRCRSKPSTGGKALPAAPRPLGQLPRRRRGRFPFEGDENSLNRLLHTPQLHLSQRLPGQEPPRSSG